MCNFQTVGRRHCGGKDVTPANHHYFIDTAFGRILACDAKRRIEARRQHGTASDQTEIPGENNIGAAVEHLPDRLMRLAAHDHRPIEGELPKTLKVRLQMPGQLAFAANDQVVADCCHQHDFHDIDGEIELPDIRAALVQYE